MKINKKRLAIKLSLGLIPVAILGVVGYVVWAFYPFWLEEGTCQLRSVNFPLRKLNYGPYMTLTSEANEVPSGVPSSARSFVFDSSTFHIQGWVWEKRGEFQLLLDQNQDGSWDHEKIRWGQQKTLVNDGSEKPWCFGPFQVKLKKTDRLTEPFHLVSYGDRFVALYPTKIHTGRMWFKQKLYRVYLNVTDLDGAMNSLFDPNKVGVYHPLCDALVFSETSNSHYITYEDEFPLGRLIKHNQDYYGIDLSSDGRLSLQPVEPVCGQLVLQGIDQANMFFSSDAASGKGKVGRDGIRLPAGHYAMQSFDLEIRDANDSIWILNCYNQPGELAGFEIRANETHTLEVGPPLQAQVQTRQRGRTVYLTLNLQGRSGEIYQRIASMRRRTKPPSFTIINEAGEILERGQFEYG